MHSHMMLGAEAETETEAEAETETEAEAEAEAQVLNGFLSLFHSLISYPVVHLVLLKMTLFAVHVFSCAMLCGSVSFCILYPGCSMCSAIAQDHTCRN